MREALASQQKTAPEPVSPVDKLPAPIAEDRTIFITPGHNFPGPGWRKTMRTRPTNQFDLSSKIHDMLYVVNDVEVEGRPDFSAAKRQGKRILFSALKELPLLVSGGKRALPLAIMNMFNDVWTQSVTSPMPSPPPRHPYPRDPHMNQGWSRRVLRMYVHADETGAFARMLSRIAKADRIFRLMNDGHRRVGEMTLLGSLSGYASRTFFLDQPEDSEFYRDDDGFINFLHDADCMAALSDPSRYLMIPATHLDGGNPADIHPVDLSPGFAEWFRLHGRQVPADALCAPKRERPRYI